MTAPMPIRPDDMFRGAGERCDEPSPLAFIGLKGPPGDVCSYDLWHDRFGGSYATPRYSGCGNRKAPDFAGAFPALGRFSRLFRLRERETIELSSARIDRLVGAVSSNLPGTVAPAFRIGVPGAHRSIVAAVPGPGASPAAFVKLPAHAGGVGAIERETAAMRKLDELEQLNGHVPRTVYSGKLRDLPLLVLSAGSGRLGPRRFGRAHRHFLELLARATARQTSFEDCSIATRWLDRLSAIETDARWRGRSVALRDGMNHLRERLSGRRITVSMAHGDFTRWNTREGPDGLFVFDWEKSVTEALPGLDAFSFDSVPRMLHARPLRIPASERASLDRNAFQTGVPANLAWLGFLIETGLHYVEARVSCPAEGEDRIADAILEEVATWLAKSP